MVTHTNNDCSSDSDRLAFCSQYSRFFEKRFEFAFRLSTCLLNCLLLHLSCFRSLFQRIFFLLLQLCSPYGTTSPSSFRFLSKSLRGLDGQINQRTDPSKFIIVHHRDEPLLLPGRLFQLIPFGIGNVSL